MAEELEAFAELDSTELDALVRQAVAKALAGEPVPVAPSSGTFLVVRKGAAAVIQRAVAAALAELGRTPPAEGRGEKKGGGSLEQDRTGQGPSGREQEQPTKASAPPPLRVLVGGVSGKLARPRCGEHDRPDAVLPTPESLGRVRRHGIDPDANVGRVLADLIDNMDQFVANVDLQPHVRRPGPTTPTAATISSIIASLKYEHGFEIAHGDTELGAGYKLLSLEPNPLNVRRGPKAEEAAPEAEPTKETRPRFPVNPEDDADLRFA